MKPHEWSKWAEDKCDAQQAWPAERTVCRDHVEQAVLRAATEAYEKALEDAARAVRIVNEAADVPGGNNPRVRSWALECAEMQIRKLGGAQEANSVSAPQAPPRIPKATE